MSLNRRPVNAYQSNISGGLALVVAGDAFCRLTPPDFCPYDVCVDRLEGGPDLVIKIIQASS